MVVLVVVLLERFPSESGSHPPSLFKGFPVVNSPGAQSTQRGDHGCRSLHAAWRDVAGEAASQPGQECQAWRGMHAINGSPEASVGLSFSLLVFFLGGGHVLKIFWFPPVVAPDGFWALKMAVFKGPRWGGPEGLHWRGHEP